MIMVKKTLAILYVAIFLNLFLQNSINLEKVMAAPFNNFMVTEDSFVKNGTDVNTNYGSNISILVKDVADSSGVDRKGYMKVGFTGFTGTVVTSATLWIYCTAYDAAGPVILSGFTNDNWSESAITWNNSPSETNLTVLSTVNIGAVGWHSFDVTNFINQEMVDKNASFKIVNQYALGAHTFSSSEASTNKPYLKLTTAILPTNYDVTKDTYIKNGTDINNNFGTATSLYVKNVDDSIGVDRISYMMFDIVNFDAYTVDDAKLYYYVNSVTYPGQLMVYGLIDDTWSETAITWNTRPSDDSNAVIIGSSKVTNIGWNYIDVSAFVNTQMASTDKKVTFRVTTQYNCGAYNIASKEGSNRPYLQLSSERNGVQAKNSRNFVDSIGVNTHLVFQGSVYDTKYATATTGIKARIDELGIRHLRDWSMKTSNTQTYSNTVYSRMNELASLNGGLKFTVIGKCDKNDASELTTAYTGAGNTWEAVSGMNEPDHEIGGSSWYTDAQQHQQTVWDWVQNNHPSLSVVGTVPANWTNYSLIGNLSNYMTVGDIHSYSTGNKPVTINTTGGAGGLYAQAVEASKDVRGQNNSYIVTETGWHNAVDIIDSSWNQETDPTVMAKHLTRSLFYFSNMGAQRTFIYELFDGGTSTIYEQQRYGLLNNDGSVKPSFTAMKNIISILDETNTVFTPDKLNFTLSGSTQYVMYTLLQKSNGKFYLALWLEPPADTTDYGVSQSVSLTFNNNSINNIKSCRVKDTNVMTDLIYRPEAGSPIGLTIYDDVTILEITK